MKQESMQLPKVGASYRCNACGMQIRLETDCQCEDGEPIFECCGQSLTRL